MNEGGASDLGRGSGLATCEWQRRSKLPPPIVLMPTQHSQTRARRHTALLLNPGSSRASVWMVNSHRSLVDGRRWVANPKGEWATRGSKAQRARDKTQKHAYQWASTCCMSPGLRRTGNRRRTGR